jgi:hypothetical protein
MVVPMRLTAKCFRIFFPLITSYWNQAAAMTKYLGDKSGGLDKLKGKKSFICITIPLLVKSRFLYWKPRPNNMALS